ncbi:hypothetical protein BDK61_2161 [Haloarcula quadrata]|uniref:Uncharacterized protein n=1 Tax=Haloarcula quadrata TaxID=182779 RepID=A0A495R6G9_9EURY|nr:hypothetical protein [Haloarcula quadrata]RKS82839.1 hypothetical protein BDK61_2161 [Haloarcula quadrata]
MATETIAFRVEEERKKEWRNAVEGTDEYDSVTHLIKKAVSRELSDSYVGGSGGDGGSNVDAEALTEIVDRLDSVESEISNMDETVSKATDAMLSAESAISEEITSGVFEALPRGRDNAVTANEIANRTGIPPVKVRTALPQLAESSGAVKRVDIEMVDGWGEDRRAEEDILWYREA